MPVKILQGFCVLFIIKFSKQDVQVSITGPTHPVPVGTNITLECHAKVTEGLYNMFFVKDGGPISSSTENPQTISFPSVQKSDAGNYTCVAIDYFGQHQRKFYNLNVLDCATWGNSSRNLTASIGDSDVNVTCDVCANPTVTYQWTHNSVPLKIFSRTLTIKTVHPNDFGVYQCTTTNTIRGVSRTFNITLSQDTNKAINGLDDDMNPLPLHSYLTDLAPYNSLFYFACVLAIFAGSLIYSVLICVSTRLPPHPVRVKPNE